MSQALIELDPRRRASFGRIGRKEHSRYLVEEREDGTLILTPAVVMSERELEMLASPARVASIRHGVEQAHAGLARPVDLSPLEDDDGGGGGGGERRAAPVRKANAARKHAVPRAAASRRSLGRTG